MVQPATGVIDFASGSLHAFNNVIDPKQVAKPVRPPRHFPSGCEIKPYMLQAALGMHWVSSITPQSSFNPNLNFKPGNQLLRTLSEGKYANEEYDFHLQISSTRTILLTKKRLFYIKKSFITRTWDANWIEEWTNCSKVVRQDNKLRVLVKVNFIY